MDAEQQKLLRHPLRDVIGNLASTSMLPGKAELRAQLEEALPGDSKDMEKLREALFVKGVELAKAAQDRSRRFELRGKADRLVLEVLEGLRDADLIVKPEPEEVVDLDAVVDVATGKGTISDTSDLFADYEEVTDPKGGRVLVPRQS